MFPHQNIAILQNRYYFLFFRIKKEYIISYVKFKYIFYDIDFRMTRLNVFKSGISPAANLKKAFYNKLTKTTELHKKVIWTS